MSGKLKCSNPSTRRFRTMLDNLLGQGYESYSKYLQSNFSSYDIFFAFLNNLQECITKKSLKAAIDEENAQINDNHRIYTEAIAANVTSATVSFKPLNIYILGYEIIKICNKIVVNMKYLSFR